MLVCLICRQMCMCEVCLRRHLDPDQTGSSLVIAEACSFQRKRSQTKFQDQKALNERLRSESVLRYRLEAAKKFKSGSFKWSYMA
eukprot:s738_g18.t1